MDLVPTARAALWKEYKQLHDLVVKFVARDELCRPFIATPASAGDGAQLHDGDRQSVAVPRVARRGGLF